MKKLAALFLFVLVSPAGAARLVSIPPLFTYTVHGASLAANRHCISADVNKVGSSSLVDAAAHTYTITLTNVSVSNIPQTVSFIMRAGSNVTSLNSSGTPPNVGSPIVNGPKMTLASDRVTTFSINRGATLVYQFMLSCNDNTCLIDAPATAAATSITMNNTMVPAGSGQTCLSLQTVVNFAIQIAEDRGAVIASIETGAHRVGGVRDKWITPPASAKVLEGRAF